jgi:hypothetical protein
MREQYLVTSTTGGTRLVSIPAGEDPTTQLMQDETFEAVDANYKIAAQPVETLDPWVALRWQRDMLVAASDWTQISTRLTADKKAEWNTYRDWLFDLPQITTDPTLVVWRDIPAK